MYCTSDANIMYDLQKQQKNLVRLSLVWNRALLSVPEDVQPVFSGPDNDESNAIQLELNATLVALEHEDGINDADEQDAFDENDRSVE